MLDWSEAEDGEMGVVVERVGDATGEGRLPGVQIIEAVARKERPLVGLSTTAEVFRNACVDRTGSLWEGEEGEGTAALAEAVAETANVVGCRWADTRAAAARGSMCVFER